jgi:hypothetical protein
MAWMRKENIGNKTCMDTKTPLRRRMNMDRTEITRSYFVMLQEKSVSLCACDQDGCKNR